MGVPIDNANDDNDDNKKNEPSSNDSSAPNVVNEMTSASFIPGQSYGSDSTLGKKPVVIVRIQQQQSQPKSRTKEQQAGSAADSATSLMSMEEIFQQDQTQIYNSIQDYYLMLKNSYAAAGLAEKSGHDDHDDDHDGHRPSSPMMAVDSFHRQNFTEFVVYYKLGQYFIRPMGVFIGKMAFEMQTEPYRIRRSSGQIDWIPYLPNDIYILADHNYVTRTNDRQSALINHMLILPQPKSTVYVLGESYRGFWFTHPSNLELKGQMSLARQMDKDFLVEERIRWNSVVQVLEGKLVVFICDYKSVILMANVDCKLLMNLMDVDHEDRTEELEINGKDLSEPNDKLEHILMVLHKQDLHSTSSYPIVPKRLSPRSYYKEQMKKRPAPQPDGGKQQQQQQEQQQQQQQPPVAPSPGTEVQPAPEPPSPPPPPPPSIPKYLGKDIKMPALPKQIIAKYLSKDIKMPPALPKPMIISIAAKMAKITDSVRKQRSKYLPSWSPGLKPKSKPSIVKTRTSKYGRKRSKSKKKKKKKRASKSRASPKASVIKSASGSGKTTEQQQQQLLLTDGGSSKKSDIFDEMSKSKITASDDSSSHVSSSELLTLTTDPTTISSGAPGETMEKKKSKSESGKSSKKFVSTSKSKTKSKSKSKSRSKSKGKSFIKILISDRISVIKSKENRKKSLRRISSALKSLKSVSKSFYIKSGKITSTESKSKSLLKLPLKKSQKSRDSQKRSRKQHEKSRWSSRTKSSSSSTKRKQERSSKSAKGKKSVKTDPEKEKQQQQEQQQQPSFISRSFERLRETARMIFGSGTSLKTKKYGKISSLSKSSMSGTSKTSSTFDESV